MKTCILTMIKNKSIAKNLQEHMIRSDILKRSFQVRKTPLIWCQKYQDNHKQYHQEV